MIIPKFIFALHELSADFADYTDTDEKRLSETPLQPNKYAFARRSV
jgi:hypothetical protein